MISKNYKIRGRTSAYPATLAGKSVESLPVDEGLVETELGVVLDGAHLLSFVVSAVIDVDEPGLERDFHERKFFLEFFVQNLGQRRLDLQLFCSVLGHGLEGLHQEGALGGLSVD
jgi:hypothetical protein